MAMDLDVAAHGSDFEDEVASDEPPPKKPAQSIATASGSRLVCVCCPKKPQLFETKEELK